MRLDKSTIICSDHLAFIYFWRYLIGLILRLVLLYFLISIMVADHGMDARCDKCYDSELEPTRSASSSIAESPMVLNALG